MRPGTESGCASPLIRLPTSRGVAKPQSAVFRMEMSSWPGCECTRVSERPAGDGIPNEARSPGPPRVGPISPLWTGIWQQAYSSCLEQYDRGGGVPRAVAATHVGGVCKNPAALRHVTNICGWETTDLVCGRENSSPIAALAPRLFLSELYLVSADCSLTHSGRRGKMIALRLTVHSDPGTLSPHVGSPAPGFIPA